MLLGQVLERLGDETFAAETLVALEDLALMVEVEAAKSAAWYAACVADEGGEELAEAAAIAKSYCCDAFYDCAANAIQLHGGIGFTWEHDAHLHLRRAATLAVPRARSHKGSTVRGIRRPGREGA